MSKSFLSAEIEHLTSVEIVSLLDTYHRGDMTGLSLTSGQHTGVQTPNSFLPATQSVPEIAALSTDAACPARWTRFTAKPMSRTCTSIETATMWCDGKGNECTRAARGSLIEEEKAGKEQERGSVVIHCFCAISGNNGS